MHKIIQTSLAIGLALVTVSTADELKVTDVEAQYAAKSDINASKELKQSINFGLANTTGNTKTLNLNGKYDASFTTVGYANEALKVAFDASAYMTKNDGIKDNEEYTANVGLEQYITDGWLGYAAVNWLRNTFQNYDNKIAIGIGLGKEVYNDGQHSLKLKLGTAYNYQDFSDAQATRKFGSLNEYAEYNNQLNDVSKLYVKVGAMENFKDFSNDYEVAGVIGFNFAVAQSISVSLEEEIRYDNFPATGFKKTDTKSIVRVGYNF